jgi:hypothetical protein
MYNIKYECRYNKDNVFLETDNVTDDEKDYIINILYREDLFNILDINDTEEVECFDTTICDLYKQLINSNELRECMRQASATIISENEELGLCILFSYDFLYITHSCICEYLESGKIADDKIQLLKNKINNK